MKNGGPYNSIDLAAIKDKIDAAELYLRNMYPQSEREAEIINKSRDAIADVNFLYERLIAMQELYKKQAIRAVQENKRSCQ